MFRDRTEAGRQLGELLLREDVEADVVLGIPRGGLPVARPVADALDTPLDVVVASKIGAPGNEELAIGAVASDGTTWRNEELIARLDVTGDYFEAEREAERAYARGKLERYRSGRNPPSIDGRRVVVVDDGVATGATARACLRQATRAGAEGVVLAIPVGSPSAIEELRGDAHEVIAVESPPHFRAVGQFYERFDQVTDEEAMSYLDRD